MFIYVIVLSIYDDHNLLKEVFANSHLIGCLLGLCGCFLVSVANILTRLYGKSWL